MTAFESPTGRCLAKWFGGYNCEAIRECKDIAVRKLRAEVEALRAERRWVPVGERLPADGQRVIVFAPSYKQEALESTYTPSHAITHRWQLHGWSVLAQGEVTHWRPLPSPPASKRLDSISCAQNRRGKGK